MRLVVSSDEEPLSLFQDLARDHSPGSDDVCSLPTVATQCRLDDPTRAFDPEHVEILIERLADRGRRVQLIVASQETARFRKLLPRSFEPQSYVVVEPKNWSYADGPELDTGYE